MRHTGRVSPAATGGPRAAAARLPGQPGVYRFRDGGGRVLYIGRATELRSRVRSYWGDLGDRGHLAPMVRRIARVEAVVCDSVHEASWLERNLLERHLLESALPRWNRTPGGAETPVYIRLRVRAAAPGLSVVHLAEPADGFRHFGPYLGGRRVRLAVSALHRVLPVSYTGTGMRGAELEMARKRGVVTGDRDELIDVLTAVLRREPAAVERVLGDLRQARDRAAGAQAFELAGRVQEEIEALGWVTCAQRATVADAGDCDAYGWSDGILVHFQVRAGRLCGWRQRACSLATARGRLAGTPPDWAAFAERTADLAAALALRSA